MRSLPTAAWRAGGFSLIEVVAALGIFSFAMLTALALLPQGLKSNQISTEETRASDLLTLAESDLRNTHPNLNAGKSQLFGLPLPYTYSAALDSLQANRLVATGTVSGYSASLDDRENPTASYTARSRFQVSVVYTRAGSGAATDFSPVEARLIVNWPSVDLAALGGEEARIRALTDPARVSGYVEAYVAFPAP